MTLKTQLVTTPSIILFQADSSLALNTSTDGASTGFSGQPVLSAKECLMLCPLSSHRHQLKVSAADKFLEDSQRSITRHSPHPLGTIRAGMAALPAPPVLHPSPFHPDHLGGVITSTPDHLLLLTLPKPFLFLSHQ